MPLGHLQCLDVELFLFCWRSLVGFELFCALTHCISAGLIKSDLRRQKANELAKAAVSSNILTFPSGAVVAV